MRAHRPRHSSTGAAATTAYYGLGRPKTEFGVVRAGLNYRFSTD
jgi:hypothetical protein